MYKLILSLTLFLIAPFSAAQNSVLDDYNQWMYEVNDTIDSNLIEPVARYYDDYIPQPVQFGVNNVFENLKSPVNVANNLLQGKFSEAGQETVRFVVNTTFGLGGVFDVATQGGLPSHKEDLGQTLAVWGVDSGPYIVLPLLGPSTLRDALGDIVDGQINPITAAEYNHETTVRVIYVIDKRASLLTATDLLKTMKGNAYLFTKESYLQKREYEVYDGQPPMKQEELDFDLSPMDSNLSL